MLKRNRKEVATMKKFISFLLVITVILSVCLIRVSASTSSIGGAAINRVVYVDSLDIFVLCGSDGIYTSTAQSDWTKRSPYTGEALNFGYSESQDVGIIVKSVSNTSDKTPVLINDLSEETSVYNITEVEDGACKSVMFFSGGFCYDPYSECFWAVGREYTIGEENLTFKRIGIYYTDGEITTAKFRGNDTGIIKWRKQTDDLYNQYEELYVNASESTYTHQSASSYCFGEMKTSGNGYIIAYYISQSNSSNQYPMDCRRLFSVIEIEKNGEGFTSNGYIATNGGAGGNVCTTMGLSSDGTLYTINASSGNRHKFAKISLPTLISEINEKGVNLEKTKYNLTASWTGGNLNSYSDITVTSANLSYSDFCALGDKCIILSKTNTSTADLVEAVFGVEDTPPFSKASFCSDEMTAQILGASYNAGKYSSIATDNKGNLCVAVTDGASGEVRVSIIDMENTSAITSSDADTSYAYISGGDSTITIAPNSFADHGLKLGNATKDKMGYTYKDENGAKYVCDLDGIDVDGIYAWDDALSGTYTFELTAYSIDFPSIKRTVTITVNIEED